MINLPLAGRVALVTGGGRGIGRAVALVLAERGAAVAVVARSSQEVAAVADAIGVLGRPALALSADLSVPAQLEAAVAQVVASLGPVDILINNAAILGPLGPTATSDPDDWEQAITINLVASYRALRAVLPTMLERRWGRIVNVSSGAATGSGVHNASAYSVSKAGLDMLTRAVAAELETNNVTINSVYPGTVDTSMQTELRMTPVEQFGELSSQRFRDLHTRGQLVEPAAPAALIIALVESTIQGETIRLGDARSQMLLRSI